VPRQNLILGQKTKEEKLFLSKIPFPLLLWFKNSTFYSNTVAKKIKSMAVGGL
jgi:hypothetical protein